MIYTQLLIYKPKKWSFMLGLLYHFELEMNKAHSASKHLYTLNESVSPTHTQKISDSDNNSLDSSLSSEEPAHHQEYPDNQREIQR